MLDNFSFVKSFRQATTDEDRAAAIAALVNDTVRHHNNGAATRSDLTGLSGDIGRVEQKFEALAGSLSGSVEKTLAGMGVENSAARDALEKRFAGDIARIEQRIDALYAKLLEKSDDSTAEIRKSVGGVVFWSFVFSALAGVGVWAAVTWPHALQLFNQVTGGKAG